MLYSSEIVGWTCADKERQIADGLILIQNIRKAAAAGRCDFTIPPGDYRFPGEEGIVFEDLRNFDISGFGVTFWFLPEVRLGISFRNCRNVTLAGVKFDMDGLPFLQGTLEEIDTKRNTFKVQLDSYFASCFCRRRNNQAFRMKVLDGSGISETDTCDCIIQPSKVEFQKNESGALLTLILPERLADYRTKQLRPAKNGDMVVLGMRHEGGMVDVFNCARMTFVEIEIYASPGFAFSETGFAEGGNTYRNCRLICRPGTDRLLASAADCFHSLNQARGPLIENCEFSCAMDDLVNIHGFFQVILEKKSDTELVVTAPCGSHFVPGHEITFYAPPYCSITTKAKILSEMQLLGSGKDFVRLAQTAFMEKYQIALRDFHDATPCLITLDRPVPEVSAFDICASYDFCGAGAVLRNNYLHDGHVRGILLKSRNCQIINNRIERIALNGIVLKPEIFWLEGPFPSQIEIENNTLSDCAAVYTELAPILVFSGCCPAVSDRFSSVINMEEIEIRKNRIIHSNAGPGIVLANIRNVSVEQNEMIELFSNPNVSGLTLLAGRLCDDMPGIETLYTSISAIIFLNCSELKCFDNVFLKTVQHYKEKFSFFYTKKAVASLEHENGLCYIASNENTINTYHLNKAEQI